MPDQPELHQACVENICALKPLCERFGMPLMVEPLVMQPNERAGGYMASPMEKERIQRRLWPDGKLSRTLIARDADVLARAFGLPVAAEQKKFFMV